MLAPIALALAATPAAAQTSIEDAFHRTSPLESVTAPFINTAGVATQGLYSGFVEINVSGTGQSFGALFNDAFYMLGGGNSGGNFYQLFIGTAVKPHPQPFGNDFAAQYVTFIDGVGDVATGTRPGYSASNSYRFVIDLGGQAPTTLTFGVTDGLYTDNSGAFSIGVYQLLPGAANAGVPEPATWAMMLLGFGAVGAVMRRRDRRQAVAA